MSDRPQAESAAAVVSGGAVPRGRLLRAVPALVAVASRLSALGCRFAMDDAYNVVRNPAVASLGRALRAAATPVGADVGDAWIAGLNAAYWRPVTTLLWAVQRKLFGFEASAFHAVSILLHAVSALVLASVMRQLGVGEVAAVLGACWWAVHTVHSETVTLVTYQAELLAALMTLLLLRHATARGDGGNPWVLAGLFALALGSKESGAAAAPLWFAAIWTRELGAGAATGWVVRRYGRGVAAFAVVGVAWLLARSWLVRGSAVTIFGALEGRQTFASVGVIHGKTFTWMLMPWPLAPFWDQTMLPPALTLADPAAISGWALFVVIAAAALWPRLAPRAAFGAAWWIAGLLPTLQIVPLPVGAAERFTYLASGGIALLLALGLDSLRSAGQRKVTGALVVVVCLGMAVASWQRARDFRDDETLYRATVRDHPDGFSGWHYLGQELLESGRPIEARHALRRADEILPGFRPNVWLLERAEAAATPPPPEPDPE